MKENSLNWNDKNGKERLNEYIKLLDKSCKDFEGLKSSYENSCAQLQKKFKHIDEINECNNKILILSLDFYFKQGFNDNLEHFRNPHGPIFLDDDYDETLKEKELHEQSDYISAVIKRQKLVSLLPQELIKLYDIVVGYQAFLDTYIPKMAHYFGFVAGNKILKKSIDGYKPDYDLTTKYNKWLSIYLDMNLD